MLKRGFLNPTELVLIAYLAGTAVLIILFNSLLNYATGRVAFRISVVILIMFIAWIQHKWPGSKVLSFIRLMFPLILLVYLYTETDVLNNFFFSKNLDPFFSKIEGVIFGLQPSLYFAKLIPYNAFAEAMYFGYFSYYLMLILVPLFFFFRKEYKIAQKTMFYIINSFMIFYMIFIVIPVAGPRFYFSGWPDLPNGYLFGSFIRRIQKLGEAPTAAFPSSHVSVCLILIIFCYRYGKKLVWFLLPVAFLLILSTVYIRAHYLVDIFAAFLITPVIYWISGWLFNRIILFSKNEL